MQQVNSSNAFEVLRSDVQAYGTMILLLDVAKKVDRSSEQRHRFFPKQFAGQGDPLVHVRAIGSKGYENIFSSLILRKRRAVREHV